MVVADHVQRVMKPNFAASWDEIGEENQIEETFALSSMKNIPGGCVGMPGIGPSKFMLEVIFNRSFS